MISSVINQAAGVQLPCSATAGEMKNYTVLIKNNVPAV